MRWLLCVLVLGLFASPTEAQVFKPKGKKPAVTEKKAAKKPAKKPAKKAARKAKVRSKAKKNASRGRKTDAASTDDPDFVKITDDDEIE